MPIDIKMPDLATTDDEVTLVRWLIEVGQSVRLGEPLLEIETDKATMEVESVAAGTLRAVHAQPGERVAVGQVIAVVENESTLTLTPDWMGITPVNTVPIQSPSPSGRGEKDLTESEVTAEAVSGQQMSGHERPTPPTTPGAAANKGSMFARNKAARVERQADTSIPLTATQREIARRLQESKQTIPHFYLTTSANAERLAALREASEPKVVWDAFFVRAVARALQDFGRAQYRFDGDKLTRNPDAIGVAADVDDVLYVVPVESPVTLTVEQISEQIVARVEQIRRGDPAARRLAGTGITITNLGAENVEAFQAIINPPEAAILAIGKIAPTVWPQDGQVIIQKRVSLSLSADHRVLNGKYAARFLSRIVQEIEGF